MPSRQLSHPRPTEFAYLLARRTPCATQPPLSGTRYPFRSVDLCSVIATSGVFLFPRLAIVRPGHFASGLENCDCVSRRCFFSFSFQFPSIRVWNSVSSAIVFERQRLCFEYSMEEIEWRFPASLYVLGIELSSLVVSIKQSALNVSFSFSDISFLPICAKLYST